MRSARDESGSPQPRGQRRDRSGVVRVAAGTRALSQRRRIGIAVHAASQQFAGLGRRLVGVFVPARAGALSATRNQTDRRRTRYASAARLAGLLSALLLFDQLPAGRLPRG